MKFDRLLLEKLPHIIAYFVDTTKHVNYELVKILILLVVEERIKAIISG
jgi:hypothetical protein